MESDEESISIEGAEVPKSEGDKSQRNSKQDEGDAGDQQNEDPENQLPPHRYDHLNLFCNYSR